MNKDNNNNNSRNGNGGTTQACAACKYQRRKCGSTCILAPYFPHDRQQQFLNAHRLFGVGKITNMVKNVPPNLRGVTMSTIMYQSDMRALDPVGGCYGQIQQLQTQIEFCNSQLLFILQQIALYRGQVHNNNANHNHGIININDVHQGSLNIIPQPAQVLNQYQQHYADEMNMSQPPPQQQQQQHHVVVESSTYDVNNLNLNLNTNYVPLQEELNTWVDSIPLSPLTLRDNRKEEEEKEEQEQEWVGDDYANDQETRS